MVEIKIRRDRSLTKPLYIVHPGWMSYPGRRREGNGYDVFARHSKISRLLVRLE